MWHWGNDDENVDLITGINYILTYIQTETFTVFNVFMAQ